MAEKGKTILQPIGGLDSDSEARFIEPTSYRYALNIRNGIAYIGEQNVVTNVKGNVEVAYTLPSGTNKCIGTYEDKQEGTMIYFVYNGSNNHTILRYFPSDTAPYGTIRLLAQSSTNPANNWGWAPASFITGIDLVNGKLLYWVDNVKPRSLDIEVSALTGKKKTWEILFPATTTGAITSPLTFTFSNKAGIPIYTIAIPLTDVSDREQIITDVAAALNADSSSSVTADGCDCKLSFEEKVADTVWTISAEPTNLFIVPKNWYGTILTDRMTDAGKYMPLNAPIATFKKDADYESNYVKGKVFQFRLQYQYRGFEDSALGVISQIPINNLGCDGTPDSAYNYIEVNFNDPLLLDPNVLCLVKKVTLLAREHNEGEWRSVIILDACDFLDYQDGALVCKYNFYNDLISSPVDAALVAKQYDNLPITAGTQKFIKNRLNYGDVEIGRDAPECVDASYEIDFVEQPNPTLYKISGMVRIFNPYLDNNGDTPAYGTQPNILERRGAILYADAFGHDLTPSPYAFFGGLYYDGGSLTKNVISAAVRQAQIVDFLFAH